VKEKEAMRRLGLAAATLLAACGGTSPSGPDPAGPIVVTFRDGGGQLLDLEAAIRDLLTSTAARVTAALPLTGVTISVVPDASRAIAGWGVGGFTPDARTVEIYVDPAFAGLAQLLPERLPPLAAHELHHAKRWSGPGYGRTLLEAMVSEGLADHFSVELLGAAEPPWSDAFPRDQTERYLQLARPELDSTAYDHERWFFGSSSTLPRWTGYTLGFRLVEAYQAGHPGATAAQLVNASATVFRLD
jgi:Predicted Zn-dependent protease (DUF2268)